MKIPQLLKLLKKHSPHNLVSIQIDTFIGRDNMFDIEYSVYFNGKAKCFSTYREMEQYIYKVTNTLSINELTKMWATKGEKKK